MNGVISPSLGLSPRRPFPDDCLAKFKPERELASGGYGSVYLARQESLDRPVAIKLLLGHVLKDAAQIQRFIAEARITASIQHPNVVTVIDHGAEHRVPWIAYEYLPGPSLRATLSNGPLSPRDAARAAHQIAEALEAAHALDVLHRDIKPDNVLAAAPGHWKVADFGIARWVDDARVKTGTGLILGTPAYIAPEQVTGAEPSRASDIYALGITLFELVTGTLPFDGENPIKLLEKHVQAPVPLPSERNPNVPAELDRLILKALAKNPAERFASARDMADTLAMFIAAPERPLRALGSGRTSRPAGRAATARVTRPSNAVAQPVAAAPAGRGGRYALAGLAAGALVLAAALMRPAPAPVPGPSASSTAAPTPRPVASPVDEMSKWLPPLEAKLRVEDSEEFDPGRVGRARALLDTIWSRAGDRGHALSDYVLLVTAADLQWWHYWMKRQRGEFVKTKSAASLPPPVAAEYRRARARADLLVEACLKRPSPSFAVTARAAVWVATLAHKYYLDIDAEGRAAFRLRLRSWSAKNPGSDLTAMMDAFLGNVDGKDTSAWTPLLARAEKDVLAARTPEAVSSWYQLLRAAILHGGAQDGKHVARVVGIEERVRRELEPFPPAARKSRDYFENQRDLALAGWPEIEK